MCSQRYNVVNILSKDIMLLDKYDNHLTETSSRDTWREKALRDKHKPQKAVTREQRWAQDMSNKI